MTTIYTKCEDHYDYFVPYLFNIKGHLNIK